MHDPILLYMILGLSISFFALVIYLVRARRIDSQIK